MEKKTTKRQLECLGRRWTMINYTTHDKTFISICTKFSREDEDKLPNDSHSFARGCFFLLDRRRHKSDLAMPWDRHRVLRPLWMVFNILLPLCNSVDGWSLLGGVSYSVFGQQFRVMCVLITQHLQSWCAKVPWSWLVVSGRNATRSELWTDRQTDADLWHHPLCLSGSIIMFIRGMYFWKIFHIIQIARIRRCQEFPYMLAAEYSIGACEWGGSCPCMRVCFGGKIEQFEIQSVALTESSKL